MIRSAGLFTFSASRQIAAVDLGRQSGVCWAQAACRLPTGAAPLNSLIEATMQALGPFGIALLMALENLFPPIPSELIMPLAGYQAAQGQMPLWLVILSGSLGSLAGTPPWYALGRVIGTARLKRLAAHHGRWLTMGPAEIEKADRWFDERGWRAVLFGRLVPTVRSLISIPAGLSDMPFGRFLLYSAIGTVIWTTLLALAGFALGQGYGRIAAFVDPVSTGVVVLIVALYLFLVTTFKPTKG